MMYHKKPLARQLRQFKKLAKDVNQLIAEGAFYKLSETQQQKLSGKLRYLYKRLAAVYNPSALRKLLAGAAIVIGLSWPTTLDAQQFAAPQPNPFGIRALDFGSSIAFADLDDDGDMDMLAVEQDTGPYDSHLIYFENNGSPTNPSFAPPVKEPFGLNESWAIEFAYNVQKLDFVDIDDDGDQDLFSSVGKYSRPTIPVFHENKGSSSNPSFADTVRINPFDFPRDSLDTENRFSRFAFTDIDDDGDQDMLQSSMFYNSPGSNMKYTSAIFFENTGTAASYNFSSTPVKKPFGIDTISGNKYEELNIVPCDLDNDGDTDFMMEKRNMGGDFYFFENSGSTTNPSFGSPLQKNPFGIQRIESGTQFNSFDLVDIDGDGDLDMFAGADGSNYGSTFDSTVVLFYENQMTTSIQDENRINEAVPVSIAPNPVNENTTIQFELKEKSYVQLELYTVGGRNVQTISEGMRGKGVHRQELDLKGLDSGIYFYQLTTDKSTQSGQLIYTE